MNAETTALFASLMLLMKAKYIRKVPTKGVTKTGKQKYRYIYHDVGTAQAAQQGEQINLHGKGVHEVVHADEHGVTLRHAKSGAERTISHNDLHAELAKIHKKRFDKGAEALIARFLASNPIQSDPSNVDAVHAELSQRFKDAGVDPQHAGRLIGFLASREGWRDDAKKALLSLASDKLMGKYVAPRSMSIARGAENLRRASKSSHVEPNHVGQAAALRVPKGGFDERLTELRQKAAVELAHGDALLGAVKAAGTNESARRAMIDYAKGVMSHESAHELETLVTAYPGLRDIPELKKLHEIRNTWQGMLAEREFHAHDKLGIPGADTTVFVSDVQGSPTPQKARYRLVEAGKVIASHDPHKGFNKHPDYPSGVQERAYHSDKKEQEKVRMNAQKLKPEYVVNTNPDAVNGPPVMTKDGLVLGGNSRAMSMQLAYADHPEAAKGYREYLRDHAHEFGLAQMDVDGMERPMLVREVDIGDNGKENMGVLVRRYNESFTQAMDPRVDQVARGRMVTKGMLDSIAAGMNKTSDDGEPMYGTIKEFLGSNDGARFVSEMQSAKEGKSVIDRRNHSQFIAKNGTLNEDGKVFVERILVGHMLPDPDLLSDMLPSHVGAIATVVPHVVRANANGHDIQAPLKAAMDAYQYMQRKQFKTVQEFNNDSGGFGSLGVDGFEIKPTLDEDSKILLNVLHKNLDKPKVLAGYFREFATQARRFPGGRQDAATGDIHSTTDLLKMAGEDKPKAKQQAMFASFGTFDAPVSWLPMSRGFGEHLWSHGMAKGSTTVSGKAEIMALPEAMFKASTGMPRPGARYIKRVPTGNPRKPWRYYYAVQHGGGVANHADMVEGASFAHGGGHYHVHGLKDGKLIVKHNVTGKTQRMTHEQLASKLSEHHAEAIAQHQAKLGARKQTVPSATEAPAAEAPTSPQVKQSSADEIAAHLASARNGDRASVGKAAQALRDALSRGEEVPASVKAQVKRAMKRRDDPNYGRSEMNQRTNAPRTDNDIGDKPLPSPIRAPSQAAAKTAKEPKTHEQIKAENYDEIAKDAAKGVTKPIGEYDKEAPKAEAKLEAPEAKSEYKSEYKVHGVKDGKLIVSNASDNRKRLVTHDELVNKLTPADERKDAEPTPAKAEPAEPGKAPEAKSEPSKPESKPSAKASVSGKDGDGRPFEARDMDAAREKYSRPGVSGLAADFKESDWAEMAADEHESRSSEAKSAKATTSQEVVDANAKRYMLNDEQRKELHSRAKADVEGHLSDGRYTDAHEAARGHVIDVLSRDGSAGDAKARMNEIDVRRGKSQRVKLGKGSSMDMQIPSFIGSWLHAAMLIKGAGHKYIRRVATGNPRRPWKYFYTVAGGNGLGHASEMKVGSKFAVKDQGKAGHFEVTHEHEDGHLTIKHDESGTEHKIHKDALAAMLRNEHAEAIKTSDAEKKVKQAAAKERALKDLADARGAGAVKHAERLKKEAVLNGASEDEVATESERKAKAEADSGKAEKAAKAKQLAEIAGAADTLDEALHEGRPNGRDYYPHGPSAINTADKEAAEVIRAAHAIGFLAKDDRYKLTRGESPVDAEDRARSEASIKDVSLSIHPAVHLNGSGKAALTKQYTDVVSAAKALVSKLEGVEGQEKALGVAKSIVKEYEHGLAVIKARAAGEVEPVKGGEKPAEVKNAHMHPNGRAFADAYEKHLVRLGVVAPEKAAERASKMVDALGKHAGGIDTEAMKATAKELGVKHQVGTIADFVNGTPAEEVAARKQAQGEAKAKRAATKVKPPLSPQEQVDKEIADAQGAIDAHKQAGIGYSSTLAEKIDKRREYDKKLNDLRSKHTALVRDYYQNINKLTAARSAASDVTGAKMSDEPSNEPAPAAKPEAPSSSFSPDKAIKIAADSIAALRKSDVFRVLESGASKGNRADVAAYIVKHRPEFADEVADAMGELGIAKAGVGSAFLAMYKALR